MKTIYLYGHLREEFGEKIRMDVQTAGECIRALETNFRGKFYNAIRDGRYRVTKSLNRDGMKEEQLHLRFASDELHIVPVIQGAGGGGKGKAFISIVLGVTLIAAAIAFAPAAAAGSGLFGANLGATAAFGVTWGQVAMFGVSLALQGVSSLLTPQAKVDGAAYAGRESPDERPSFLFNGAVNTTEQGGPVPYIFGEIETGSIVISGSLTPERLPVEST